MRIPDLIYILHALHVTICMRRHQCYAWLPMYYRMARKFYMELNFMILRLLAEL